MITNVGSNQIKRFLAGVEKNIAVSIAIGTSNTNAESTSDISLDFEYASYPIVLSSYDPVNDIIIFKCEIPQEVVATIYEVGLFSNDVNRFSGNFQSSLLLDYSADDGSSWTSGSYYAHARTGVNSLRLFASSPSTTISSVSNYLKDFSGYSNLDTFKLAYFINDARTSNITLRFKNGVSDYFSYSITPSTTPNYYVQNFTKGAMTQTGSPDWASIQYVEMIITSSGAGTTTVDFDGLRIEDTDAPSFDKVLVDRKVLVTPVIKNSTVPLEIEFPMIVNIV